MSLLPGSLSESANGQIPWTRSRLSPLDPLARHLHADEPHPLHAVLVMCHHPRSGQGGLEAGPSTLLVTAVDDDL